MVRSPYAFTSFTHLNETYKPLFKSEYAFVLQNERGSEWSEGEFGYLTSTTNDARDTLDWIAGQDWSNGLVGAHGCSSTAENQLKLGAIGPPRSALRADELGRRDRLHPTTSKTGRSPRPAWSGGISEGSRPAGWSPGSSGPCAASRPRSPRAPDPTWAWASGSASAPGC